MAQGHGQGAQDQLGGEARARRPADDPAAVEIEEGGHVEPSFSGAHLGDVTHPSLIWCRGPGLRSQSVRGDGLGVPARRRAGHKAARTLAPEPRGLHQSGDAFAAVALAAGVQHPHHSRAATDATMLAMHGSDRLGQLRIGTAADTRLCIFPAVVARPAHGERGAPRGQGMFVFHGFDALVAGRGTSERMPSVFLICRAALALAPMPRAAPGSRLPDPPAAAWRHHRSAASTP